jgi:hypothetical protein
MSWAGARPRPGGCIVETHRSQGTINTATQGRCDAQGTSLESEQTELLYNKGVAHGASTAHGEKSPSVVFDPLLSPPPLSLRRFACTFPGFTRSSSERPAGSARAMAGSMPLRALGLPLPMLLGPPLLGLPVLLASLVAGLPTTLPMPVRREGRAAG